MMDKPMTEDQARDILRPRPEAIEQKREELRCEAEALLRRASDAAAIADWEEVHDLTMLFVANEASYLTLNWVTGRGYNDD